MSRPVTASALAAKMGDAKQYGCSRDFAASVGLVPRQYSTGGKADLFGLGAGQRIIGECGTANQQAKRSCEDSKRNHGRLPLGSLALDLSGGA